MQGENWRMCYKALLLLEFLVKQGPAKVADDVAASASVLDRLTRFQYKDANGKDHVSLSDYFQSRKTSKISVHVCHLCFCPASTHRSSFFFLPSGRQRAAPGAGDL